MSQTNKKNQNAKDNKQNTNGPKKDPNVNTKLAETIGSNVTEPSEEIKETVNGPINIPLTQEHQEEVKDEIVNTPSEETKEEIVEPLTDRKILAYHHKACHDTKKATNTTLKSTEHLRSTDGKVTREINGTPTEIPVYSLKRGNRIYYVIDVTPADILKATRIAKEKLANATPATPVVTA